MNASQVKAAARHALSRFIEKGRDETSTADYTAVVYRETQSIIVQWVVEKRDGSLIEKNRVFKISVK
ncbi:hypothetical protein [Rhizobium phage RHph_X2_26]|nr:hypothetical protein [Rhizobium phage RHph_X2_26]